MAITTALATSFKVDLLDGTFGGFVVESPMNNVKIALFTSGATLGAATTVYPNSSPSFEVVGSGYVAGGKFLVVNAPTSSGTTAFADFVDVVWSSSTITARGCQIYDTTNSNAAISSHDFGSDKSSSSGDFTVVFPTPDSSNAIIRIA